MTDLTGKHLSELHELARERGIEGYRRLRRDELVERLTAEGDEAPRRRGLRRRGRRGRGGGGGGGDRPQRQERARARDEPRGEAASEPETERVTGVLEVTPQGYGFIRLPADAGEDDVYISASQIRRCELKEGDEVGGPARAPRRGERHRALVHVDSVNGGEPPSGERVRFEDLTPVVPRRRVPLDADPGDVLVRAVDLVAPLALGQRVLVSAAPRSGRTTLLRALASALAGTPGAPAITVLLIDERPEEATGWREALPGAELAIATAEMAPAEQVRVAERTLEQARTAAAGGADVVLLVDSLSRLAAAAGDAAVVKRLFGSGRDLAEEDAGSLTVIATVVAGAEDDGLAERAVATTENSLIVLDPDLAGAGVVPALRAADARVSNEEELREQDELDAVRRLREELSGLEPREAAALLRERIESTPSNAELLK